MLNYELKYWNKGVKKIAGCDEVGRGCCAGPLVCAAVMFPENYSNKNIKDSKKLTQKQREKIFEQIVNDAISYSIVFVDSKKVDLNNPKQSSKFGMLQAIENLKVKPELVLTDFEKIKTHIEQENIVKGDNKSINIAAASILAKVSRDKYMDQIDLIYPQYGFKKHKGYCTKQHQTMMEINGITSEHRITYKNVIKAIEIFNNSNTQN